jgi:hypothetical protein
MEVAGQYANLIRHKSNTMKWDPGLHTNAETIDPSRSFLIVRLRWIKIYSTIVGTVHEIEQMGSIYSTVATAQMQDPNPAHCSAL